MPGAQAGVPGDGETGALPNQGNRGGRVCQWLVPNSGEVKTTLALPSPEDTFGPSESPWGLNETGKWRAQHVIKLNHVRGSSHFSLLLDLPCGQMGFCPAALGDNVYEHCMQDRQRH